MVTTSNDISRRIHGHMVRIAVASVKGWAGDSPSRETVAELLPTWQHAVGLTDRMRADVLAEFDPEQPAQTPGVTFLPAEHAELDALPTVEQAVALGQTATTVGGAA